MARPLSSPILKKFFGALGLSDLPDDARLRICYAIYGYALKVHDFNEMRKLLKPNVVGADVNFCKQKIMDTFDLLVSFKMAFYRVVKTNNQSKSSIKKLLREYGIRKEWPVFLALYRLGVADKIAVLVEKIPLELIKHPKRIHRECGVAIKECEGTLKWLARRYNWIATSNKYQFTDLLNEFTLKSTQVYYWAQPCTNRLHTINNMKSSATRYAINYSKFYKTKSRGRLENTEEGWNNKIQIINDQVLETFEYEEDNTLPISIKQLIARYGDKSKRTKVIRLLMGQEDKNFVQHFNTNHRKNRRCHDVDDVMRRAGSNDNYLEIVRSYVGFKEPKFYKFINNLRSSLK